MKKILTLISLFIVSAFSSEICNVNNSQNAISFYLGTDSLCTSIQTTSLMQIRNFWEFIREALAGKRIRVVSFRLSSSGYLNDFDDGSSLIWGRDLSGNVKADVILSNQRHAHYRRCHKCPD